jgi:integrase/recombinase XerD
MQLNEYLQQHYSKKTAIAYQREIEIYISSNRKAEKYTYSEIINHIGILRIKYTNSKTINRILSSIKAYYNYLCFIEVRKDNPTKSIRLRDKQSRDIQLQDLFTTEELEALLTAKKERYTNLDYRNKVLMSLLIYQALKPNETEALECDEINLEEASIYIKSSSKNNSRTLALKANQILMFKKYLEEIRPKLVQENETKAFIIGQRKGPMSAQDISKHIKRNYNIYPPRKVTALSIRQSVIANLLKQHNDLRIVQVFAGHKYPSATEKYRQNNVEALQTALQQYHPMR